MKILMINVVCGIRSTGRICTDLAIALEAEGHEVKIAYGREEIPEQFRKYAVRIGQDIDVNLHGLKARLMDGTGFGSKKATMQFVEWVKIYDPDVIHLHNLHGYYINVAVLFDYLRTCGKKIIWTLHDCWAFTGHSAYCDAVKCERWKEGCYACPQSGKYPKAFIDRSKMNWIKKKAVFSEIPDMILITPSHWLAGLVKQSFLSEYPVEVIRNGVDTSQFTPLKNDFRKIYGLEDKFILLGVATSWNDLKGYSDFLQLSKLINNDYKIVMVGLTKRQLKKLPNNILGIERTANIKELAYLYSSADVFINLTYCDSYGLVNAESILCGTPVVSYDTGGCSESVGRYGYIVPQGNLEAVIDMIQKIRNTPFELNVDSDEYDTRYTIESYFQIYSLGSKKAGK